jgi:hypothetical protein
MLSAIEITNSQSEYSPVERRHSVRHKLQEGPLAIDPRILGPVLDLSMHGMSFEYSGEDLENATFMNIGIFISESKTIITGLQARIIRDHISTHSSSFIPVIRKIRAVEFLNLSPEQRRQIRQIIATQSVHSF